MLEKEIISGSYESKDCENGIDWLIADMLQEIAVELKKNLTHKPIQANFTFVYNANLNGSENDNDIKG